jgi:hypothetical protein
VVLDYLALWHPDLQYKPDTLHWGSIQHLHFDFADDLAHDRLLTFTRSPKPTATPLVFPSNSSTFSWTPTSTGSHQLGPVCSILLPAWCSRVYPEDLQGRHQTVTWLLWAVPGQQSPSINRATSLPVCSIPCRPRAGPQTAKTHLVPIRNQQLSLGLPDPCDTSALPQLKLLLAEVRWVRACDTARRPRVHLPIILSILAAIKQMWEQSTVMHNTIMLWAATTACVF